MSSIKAIALGRITSGGGGNRTLPIHICVDGEYDSQTGKPTITNPDENVFYLVPTGDTTGDDQFKAWVYSEGRWESMSVDIPQSDWAQTDSTAADYIKNRDKAPRIDNKEYYLENEVVNLESASGNIRYHYINTLSQCIPLITQIVAGKSYNVRIDNIVFSDVPAVSVGGGNGIGLGAQNPGDSTNFAKYGFGIGLTRNGSDSYAINSFVFSDGGEHTFSIYTGGMEYAYQADWNENDESSAQHIKNRIGGYYTKGYATVAGPAEVSATWYKNYDGVYSCNTSALSSLTATEDYQFGETYSVIIDGKEYSDLSIHESGNSYVLGGDMPTSADQGASVKEVGFCIVLRQNGPSSAGTSLNGVILAMNETASSVTKSFTIEIKKQKDVIAKIPKEYLDVQDQVQADWNQTDTDAKDYVKNKPNIISYSSNGSFAAGIRAKATSQDSFAAGHSTASASWSTALGYANASGPYSFATNAASGIVGIQEYGDYIINFGDAGANGRCSFANGVATAARAQSSHSEGGYTIAYGTQSHSDGYCTVATGKSQHVFGEFNVIDGDIDENGVYIGGGGTSHATDTRTNYVEIVGNGELTLDGSGNTHNGKARRSNARTLDWSGNEWLAGNLTAAGGSITIGSTTITEAQLQALLAMLN